MTEQLQIIEGLLFIQGEDGVTLEDMSVTLEIKRTEAATLIEQLRLQYDTRGLTIMHTSGKYRLATRKEQSHYYQRFFSQPKRQTLSKAALEVLAIIAYNAPITRATIEHVRGVSCEKAIKTLLQFELIQEAGRESTVGRPMLYATTDLFLDYFGLVSLAELPPLRQVVVGDVQEEVDLFMTRYQEELADEIADEEPAQLV
ncbi:MAG: SMC-Scp complex subunit ScpB, partial [Culicoidibacterales bacterium]